LKSGDVAAIVREACSLRGVEADARQISMHLDVPESLVIATDSAHLPHLFDEFFRSDTDATRQRQATGLGLSIVDRVVGRLGGTVTVESTLSEGTTVRVELPLGSPTV